VVFGICDQTDKHTDRHIHMLIAILCTGDEVLIVLYMYNHAYILSDFTDV